MELFFDLLFTTVCVFIPKCGLFAGLNFEAILVVLIDVLLLVYLICKASSDGSLWKHGNYQTLNSVANLPHSHESVHVRPFLLCRFQKPTESELF